MRFRPLPRVSVDIQSNYLSHLKMAPVYIWTNGLHLKDIVFPCFSKTKIPLSGGYGWKRRNAGRERRNDGRKRRKLLPVFFIKFQHFCENHDIFDLHNCHDQHKAQVLNHSLFCSANCLVVASCCINWWYFVNTPPLHPCILQGCVALKSFGDIPNIESVRHHPNGQSHQLWRWGRASCPWCRPLKAQWGHGHVCHRVQLKFHSFSIYSRWLSMSSLARNIAVS